MSDAYNIGWAILFGADVEHGSELGGLVDCLAQEGCSQSLTLLLSLIFESTRNEGTVRSTSE